MKSSLPERALCAVLLLLGLASAAMRGGAQTPVPGSAAAGVFRRYADHVVRVQIVETNSGAKAEVGSGFYVSPDGLLITNFHVVSQVVHRPDRYRAELTDRDGQITRLRLVAVDAVHDLALLHSGRRVPRHFTIAPVDVSQGARLYAFGHPEDLGLSIVEGTFNGHLAHTLYPKIHFTGSLNPGMSGGPAVDDAGRVVGVNVSTAGNQLSFLVPVERAVALLERGRGVGAPEPPGLLADVGRQLLAYQDRYLKPLFADSSRTVALGPFTLPTEPASFFKCWGDADRDRERPYQLIRHQCSTDDEVYLSAEQSSGIVAVEHHVLTSDRLIGPRFFALYSSSYSGASQHGAEEEVTSFRCQSRNVARQGRKLRAALCVRRYRKFEGLYDAVLSVASLGTGRSGLISRLTLTGVSFDNAQTLSRRYLEGITWRD